ncbi:MAG: transposase [Betaproteobacteria bacterium]|nr:transposase [Betaproteobacteria bacterium]
MSRPLRLELAGGLYHVTSHGDRREDIYLDDGDRLAWLNVLAQCCERFNWVVHAWCQMTNHYHLLVETPEANLSAGMRQLNGVYTQLVNQRHRRVGHVFQGRYKAILVDRDSYLLELARYVVLNPVRAGMVKHAKRWPWSSYGAMIGSADAPAWLNRDWLLGQFGAQRARQVARYAEFVQEGVRGPAVWEGLKGQIFLGTDEFVRNMQSQLENKPAGLAREVPRAQRRALAKSLAYYRDEFDDAKEGMTAAYATGDYTLQAIADVFGVHYSTVSRAVAGK